MYLRTQQYKPLVCRRSCMLFPKKSICGQILEQFWDPKFAPKPRPPEGLANALALSQEAPASASPLPDFDMITHSGYTLARISFRTILIKKWKQCFWVTYGTNQILFFSEMTFSFNVISWRVRKFFARIFFCTLKCTCPYSIVISV